jgi:thiol-disulfide isomerase/thioredoxin
MKNIIIFILVILSIKCSNDTLSVKVVTVPELFNNVKYTNESTLMLLNIWSTSCIPCVQEFPYIVNLKNHYDISKLNIVFLSTDWDENAEDVEKFLLSQKVRGQHYRKEEGNTQKFIDDICPSWSGAVPFTGIFSRELSLLSFWEGKRDEKFFISKIDSLLESKGEIL